MRVMVVSNMAPGPQTPGRGQFVRDQVAAVRARGDVEVELVEFAPGDYLGGVRAVRRHGSRWDVVHAHFGLTAYVTFAVRGVRRAVTLHGTDVRHPRTGRLTRAILPRLDLVAVVSPELGREIGRPDAPVLPAGVDLERFRPLPRAEARERLGLDPDRPYLLFPADPARPGKRADLARRVAGDVPLLTLGDVPPDEVPWWINAANAVVLPSEAEGFGLAVLEALACDVPVLATPVGVHAEALADVPGTLCAPFDEAGWRAALEPHLAVDDPRVAGRRSAERWSSTRMADRVVDAWSALTGARLYSATEAPGGSSSV
jgi:glycosyltransferase involved in cell wall biosynthesis